MIELFNYLHIAVKKGIMFYLFINIILILFDIFFLNFYVKIDIFYIILVEIFVNLVIFYMLNEYRKIKLKKEKNLYEEKILNERKMILSMKTKAIQDDCGKIIKINDELRNIKSSSIKNNLFLNKLIKNNLLNKDYVFNNDKENKIESSNNRYQYLEILMFILFFLYYIIQNIVS